MLYDSGLDIICKPEKGSFVEKGEKYFEVEKSSYSPANVGKLKPIARNYKLAISFMWYTLACDKFMTLTVARLPV